MKSEFLHFCLGELSFRAEARGFLARVVLVVWPIGLQVKGGSKLTSNHHPELMQAAIEGVTQRGRLLSYVTSGAWRDMRRLVRYEMRSQGERKLPAKKRRANSIL